MVNYSIGVIV